MRSSGRTIVVSIPFCASTEVTSIPMNPPPITTARFAFSAFWRMRFGVLERSQIVNAAEFAAGNVQRPHLSAGRHDELFKSDLLSRLQAHILPGGSTLLTTQLSRSSISCAR